MSNQSSETRQPKRAQRRAEKTLRLLQIAMEMVVEGGMDALTMPGLAKRAGVAVGGLYRYFAGKQELIAGLQLHALGQLDEWLVGQGELVGAKGAAQLVLSIADFANDNPTSYLLLEMGVSDPRRMLDDEVQAKVQAAVDPVIARVADLLDEAAHDGELTRGDSIQRTLALWGLVVGALHGRKNDDRLKNKAWASRKVLEVGVRAMIDGWRA